MQYANVLPFFSLYHHYSMIQISLWQTDLFTHIALDNDATPILFDPANMHSGAKHLCFQLPLSARLTLLITSFSFMKCQSWHNDIKTLHPPLIQVPPFLFPIQVTQLSSSSFSALPSSTTPLPVSLLPVPLPTRSKSKTLIPNVNSLLMAHFTFSIFLSAAIIAPDAFSLQCTKTPWTSLMHDPPTSIDPT